MGENERRPAGRPWPAVVAAWLTGVFAAFGLGTLSPYGTAVQADLGLSLGEVAWATSSITAVSALLGIPAAWWISSLGARRVLMTGLLVMAVAAAASAAAPNGPLLVGARTVQGLGYLLVFVGGPIALTRLARGRTQAAALALWGTCIPAGLALATALGGAASAGVGWRGWLAGSALVAPVLAAVVHAVLPPLAPSAGAVRYGADGERTDSTERTDGTDTVNRPDEATGTGAGAAEGSWARPVYFALSFACVCVVGVAFVVLLPTFLQEERDASSALAGTVTALVSLGSVLGSVLSGLALRAGAALGRIAPVLAVMPLAVLAVFTLRMPPGLLVGVAALALVANGIMVSAMFAAVPQIAGDPRRVDVTNGCVAQLGSLGTLLGPPAFGTAVAGAGWPGAAAAAVAFTAAGTVSLRAALGPVRPGSGSAKPAGQRAYQGRNR